MTGGADHWVCTLAGLRRSLRRLCASGHGRVPAAAVVRQSGAEVHPAAVAEFRYGRARAGIEHPQILTRRSEDPTAIGSRPVDDAPVVALRRAAVRAVVER